MVSESIYEDRDKTLLNETIYTLDDDFKIFINSKSISIPKSPIYHPMGILGICLEGNASIKVHQQEYRIENGGLLVILPGQVISLNTKSNDFRISYFIISESLINDVLSGISRLSPLFFIHIRKEYYYKLAKDEIYRYNEYHNLIYSRLTSGNDSFQKEFIVNTLRLFYLDLYNNYKNSLLSPDFARDSRKEQLAYSFFLLIMKHYKENREVTFYAKKLFITPKYLSAVIKEVSGRAAKDWITEYILLEIKSLLKTSPLNIQEIAVRTKFSNQASLGRFFRKHTGVSPSEYRVLDEPD
ncbi:AraC-like DNA-binding protein [Dysgonomonas sp. PFB1-18]|uniref:helix-turn-helix domain-containing protein n=1 Tax=unclassified Dysgonomonas TaxID=2630389 RepID=UPI0024746B2E|nr:MULTISPECIES: helix-turn-helix domain-containing protein [unclassified Dysgonomonas]MDH6310233.1 AraC-like DNA-binding protein [Dysgonomonas sp. PF1-14]MDH6340052.1 AraC-like DNA-binding protein [Dysgonomonas sp. PF1-16]MDH6381841.1 AraC-like DNA-binding protein [Dysgonomonas sp. PFB1-18]MDH6398917.1 AraC-like DNA-binding protein [Dysgonomonas sp. PF1-23]